jgi:GTP-binding protein
VQRARFVKSAGRKADYPRQKIPAVAFAGRSNVGKSSLINCLVGAKQLARTSSTPGRTQYINFFSLEEKWMLIDLPGYGYAKVPERVRGRWASMIEEFFCEYSFLRMTVVIVDARREPAELDLGMVEYLEELGVPFVIAATKIDKVAKSRRLGAVQGIRMRLPGSHVVAFSSTTGEGRRELWQVIENSKVNV